MPNSYGFRGLLKLLNAELTSEKSESFTRLTLTFDTLDSHTGEAIRFSLTRAYEEHLPHPWCVADLCEYAMQHELAESVPALFVPPVHRPGLLDDDKVAQTHAVKATHRYVVDKQNLRWEPSTQKLRELKSSW